MADRKQGAGWSSGSSAAGHKAHWGRKKGDHSIVGCYFYIYTFGVWNYVSNMNIQFDFLSLQLQHFITV